MWKLSSKLASLILLISLFFPNSVLAAHHPGEAYIPQGTKLTLKLMEDVNAKNYKPGDRVQMILLGDVTINHTIVIRSHSRADAEVIKANHAGVWGRSGQIIIQVDALETVNGIRVPLISQKKKQVANHDNALTQGVIGGLFIKGAQAELHKGTIFQARVAEDTGLGILVKNLPSLNVSNEKSAKREG